jgi:hypothetical protein
VCLASVWYDAMSVWCDAVTVRHHHIIPRRQVCAWDRSRRGADNGIDAPPSRTTRCSGCPAAGSASSAIDASAGSGDACMQMSHIRELAALWKVHAGQAHMPTWSDPSADGSAGSDGSAIWASAPSAVTASASAGAAGVGSTPPSSSTLTSTGGSIFAEVRMSVGGKGGKDEWAT